MTLDNCTIFTYADDTALLVTGNNWEAAKHNVVKAMKTIMEWLSENLLTLNLDKTKLIRFDISKNRGPESTHDVITFHVCPDLDSAICDCKTLKAVSSVKYLGVFVDEKLDWHVQINSITTRVRRLIYIFKNLRNSADRTTLFMVYFGL